MERLLFAYAGVGLATGAAALALLALAPFWEKRYAARFRCIVWLALAVRLLVPFAAPLPAPAPRWEGKRNILYGGSYWPREDAWFTAACDADEEHPGRVTLYTSRDGGAQWTAQPLDLVGEGQNTPIENIYCMEVVRDRK